MPLMTVAKSSRSVQGHLEELIADAAKLDFRRLHRVSEAGLESDEFRETIDALRTHCQLYEADEGAMA